MKHPLYRPVLALLAGLSCVFGFAPFNVFLIPVLSLAMLFVLWQQASNAKQAAWLGFSFGLGLFGAGISWIYVALNVYGGMVMPLAAAATLLFAAFLALFPTLVGYLQARVKTAPTKRLLLLLPALWVLSEWVRGLIFTGFPWLTLGYAHSNSPLAGFAPVMGVYGVSLMAALCAGSMALLYLHIKALNTNLKLVFAPRVSAMLLLLIAVGGAALHQYQWTQPQGQPLSVTLIQGNINQHLKFRQETLLTTLHHYRDQVLASNSQLIVLPETAFPLFRQQVPSEIYADMQQHAAKQGSDVIIGLFELKNELYYNSAFTVGTAPSQFYHKQHLVPFGEFIPLRSLLGPLITDVLKIPMGETARGATHQAPLNVAGQQVAVNICYEDVFGEEIIRALPQASLLVNITNDAWYGRSHAAAQHNQISQFRAMEAGRMMLRATNTGLTSIIDVKGRVLAELPQHQALVLDGQAQGYRGTTPYVRWGNGLVIGLILLMLCLMAYKPRQSAA